MTELYRKKPVVIEAIQWDGEDCAELIAFVGDSLGSLGPGGTAAYAEIRTLEGSIYASAGDWIIRGVQGEFYPCKPDIFAATYEPASTTSDCEAVAPTDVASAGAVTGSAGGA